MILGIKILISAQNVHEVDQILEEPPDILDLKNPKEGSLGAPSIPIIDSVGKKIVAFNNNLNQKVKFSVAIGDFPNLPGTASMASYGAASFFPDFVKIGLYGPRSKEEAITLTKSVVESVHIVNPEIQVVVVGYADQKEINASVNPLLIPEIASLGGADIAMLDTKIKNGQSLFDHLSLLDIQQFVNLGRDMNVEVALAGSLNFQHIDCLNKLQPDIIGVRSMVCGNFDRLHGEIQPKLITKLKIYLL